MKYVIAYDVGTTGVKTCIFSIGKKINLLAGVSKSYALYTFPNGGAEQDHDEWWHAMCVTTKEAFSKCKVKPNQIEAISFCSQAQGLILVDKDGVPVRRPMSYMDQRATNEIKKGMQNGIQIAGGNIFKVIPSLIITGAASLSVKDPMWKYKWIEANEPENFARAYKWLDVKDYLICRCTGEFKMTQDDAFATMLYDNRKGKQCWSKKLCKMFKINMDHLPTVIKASDCAGFLRKEQAKELGLVPGIKVFGGGGDNSLIGIGAGCSKVGDTHVYIGTSGWVSTITDKRKVDITSMIASISSPEEDKYNYFAEMETAGKCFDWVIHHLALDEIDIYLEKVNVAERSFESKFKTLYEYLHYTVKDVPPGSNGVLFAPWFHGNRCPFEDPNATGMFIGLKLENGKRDMIRAVLEGIIYHIRWMLECEDKKVKTAKEIRFVGGGAMSPFACQLVSDIIGRKVVTIKNPQNVGAVGAAAVMGVGLGLFNSLEEAPEHIEIDATYTPNEEKHELFEPYYQTFKMLHKSNKENFKVLKEKSAAKKVKRKEEIIRAFKFFLFSASAGIIQLLVTTLLGLPGIPLPTSAVYLIGLVCSVLWNFTFNRKFTFKSANNIPKAMALAFLFYVFFAPASTIFSAYLTNGDVLGIFYLNNHLGILGSGSIPVGGDIPLEATLVTTFLCMVPNLILEFLWQKFVVFRKSIDTNEEK